MIHWNSESDNIGDVHPEINFLFRFGLPETYQAADLGDFYHHRREIVPTRRLGPMGLFYNGTAFVSIAPGAVYTPLSRSEGQLRDVTCFFTAGLTRHGRVLLPASLEPFKMYQLVLRYTVKTDSIAVHHFQDHGPEAPQGVTRSNADTLFNLLRPRPALS